MNVETGLSMLSESTMTKMINEQDQRLGDSSELDLHARLTSSSYVSQLFEKITDPEREVIHLFLFQSVQGFVSKRQWDRLVRNAHVRLTLGLTRLRRLGLILTVRKLWSEVGYVMPLEVREILMALRHRTEGEEKTLVCNRGQAPSYYIRSGRGIHLDLFALLLFLRDQEVPLTQKKTIHRRMLTKLNGLFSLRDEHVTGWYQALFARHIRDVYPAATAVLLDLALRLSLVRQEQNRLRLQADKAEEWLKLPEAVRWSRTMRILISHYLPAQPWLEAFVFQMSSLSGEAWLSVAGMIKKVKSLGYELPDDAERIITNHWLHPLLGFGWIQMGLDEEQQLVWRWNPLIRRESGDGWYIQPTGEIIVPPLVSLKRIWELSRLGELSFAEEFIRCTLDSRRVQTFVGQGGSPDKALSFLQEGCIHPLPDSVRDMVDRWSKEAKQIWMERVIRVRAADPHLLEEMRAIPFLAPYMDEIISATDFLIRPGQEVELSAALRRCGYEPQLSTSGGNPVVTRQFPTEPQQQDEGTGLFSDQRPWTGYRVENTFPEPDDQITQLSALPVMWTRHFQTYHPRTLRDLCKRAVELTLEVRIELATGEEWLGTPLRVEVEMGHWVLTMETERKKSSCRLDEIRRAQIVLPEYL
jgi:hypothetical protein